MKNLFLPIATLALMFCACSKAPLSTPASNTNPLLAHGAPAVVVMHIPPMPPPRLSDNLGVFFIYGTSFDSINTGVNYNELAISIHNRVVLDSFQAGCGMAVTNTLKYYHTDTVSNKKQIAISDSTRISLPSDITMGDTLTIWAFHYPAPQFWVKVSTFVYISSESGMIYVRTWENNGVYPSFCETPANLNNGAHLVNSPAGIIATIYLP